MRLLHIHADYPDGSGYPSTAAVKNLLELVPEHEHWIIAIHRTSNPFKVGNCRVSKNVWSMFYWGLPLGLGLNNSLTKASRQIRQLVANLSAEIDLVHGHKLAIDGVLAADVAGALRKPYMISVRGGTDVHVIGHKPSLRPKWKQVLYDANHIFWVSKWAQPKLNRILDIDDAGPTSALPNSVNMSVFETPPENIPRARFLTVVSFHQYKRKGLLELISAIGALTPAYPDIHLDIYGGGDEAAQLRVSDMIKRKKLERNVKLVGIVPPKVLADSYKNYTALLLPSQNESFGMAYIEALLAGIPSLYHAETGVDGYLGEMVGERVTSQEVGELCRAVSNLIEHQSEYRDRILDAKRKNILEQFTASEVAAAYRRGLAHAIKGEDL